MQKKNLFCEFLEHLFTIGLQEIEQRNIEKELFLLQRMIIFLKEL